MGSASLAGPPVTLFGRHCSYSSDTDSNHSGWAEIEVIQQRGVLARDMSGKKATRNIREGEVEAGVVMTEDINGDTEAETGITGGGDILPHPLIPPRIQTQATDHTNDTRNKMKWRG